jgi:putative transposase
VKFAAIADWAEAKEFPVDFMCQQLQVSRSGYYRWVAAQDEPLGPRAAADEQLTTLLVSLHTHLKGNPGVRRLRADLAVLGHRVSHKRVWRLMRAVGIVGRHPKPWKRTTIPGEQANAPDLVGRAFTAPAADFTWCGDITYVRTWTGWAYLATVIDLHNRALVGWAIADHLRTDLVIDALQMAITDRRPGPGVIFHSDRGCQYTSAQFAAFCAEHHITRSLGRTGSCFDNAVAESFNATYKKELIHTRPWPDIHTLRTVSAEWFTYYNTERRHSYNNYLTPAEKQLGLTTLHQIVTTTNAA